MIRAGVSLLLTAMLALPASAQDLPRPKSQKEADDINACMSAPDMETRVDLCEVFLDNHPKSEFREIALWVACTPAPRFPDRSISYCQKLLVEFKDTEHKEGALYLTTLGYQQANDFEGMLTYGELVLEENPEHWGTLLALAYVLPLRTRKYDLDKEEKLSQAEGYAKRALDIIPRAENPNPDMITDDDWLLEKKDLMANAHKSIGSVAAKREDWAAMEKSYRQALQLANEQTGEVFYHIAKALKEQGKKDEALGMLDQSVARGGFMMPNGRDAAAILKAEIALSKAPPAGGAETAPGAAAPATPAAQP
jgi:tetratricopeptide (TPR) repeat protein